MTVRAMKAGAIDFLAKPFREQELVDAIAQALQGRSAATQRVGATVGLDGAQMRS
jgi:FixJ family two-component response regulator